MPPIVVAVVPSLKKVEPPIVVPVSPFEQKTEPPIVEQLSENEGAEDEARIVTLKIIAFLNTVCSHILTKVYPSLF